MKGTRLRPKPPATLFSTSFRSSAGAVRRRLGNLFATGGRTAACWQWPPWCWWSLPAVWWPAPARRRSPRRKPLFRISPRRWLSLLNEYAAESWRNCQGIPARLPPARSPLFKARAPSPAFSPIAELEVYQVVYRLKAADPDMMLAGGSWMDDEGWYHPDSFFYYLVGRAVRRYPGRCWALLSATVRTPVFSAAGRACWGISSSDRAARPGTRP